MNANTLYDIYETNREHGFHDLIFGLAQYKVEHPAAISHDEDKAIREFIGRHGQRLAAAYKAGEAAFAAAVAEAEEEDAEAEQGRGEAEE